MEPYKLTLLQERNLLSAMEDINRIDDELERCKKCEIPIDPDLESSNEECRKRCARIRDHFLNNKSEGEKKNVKSIPRKQSRRIIERVQSNGNES